MVLVNHSAGADALGLVGIAQGRERLIVVARGDARYHSGFGITAQGVFQEPGKDLGR